MSGWTINPMKLDDLDQVIAIENDVFSTPWSRSSYESEIIRHDSFNLIVRPLIDDIEHPVIAYISFRIIIDEMHLFKIAVHRKWQKKGVASRLLSHCLIHSARKGASVAYLEVRASNKNAISLYKKVGFTVSGKRQRYYSDTKEDALIMVNNIKQEAIS